MSLKKFLISWPFLKNTLLALAILVVLVFATMVGLHLYTNHGDSYPVPDLTGLSESEVQEITKEYNLRYLIVDSIYNPDFEPGATIDQIPKPGFKVKKNRRIVLTINANSPEKVSLPKLRDISFRQVQVLIENSGLLLGEVSFEPSEYKNLVLNASIDSIEVFEGDIFPKATKVDIVVGKGFGNEKTTIPDIIGASSSEAQAAITNALLNLGVVIYDKSITSKEDSLNAAVWKQRPNPEVTSSIEVGASIDIWITVDKIKINDAIEGGR